MDKVKYIVCFLFFFLLFYSETEQIGNLTFSQIWKIPLVLFLFVFILKKKINRPSFSKINYWFAIVHLFNKDIVTNFIPTVFLSIKFLNFSLLYDFISTKFKKASIISSITLRISQYFILTNIPFILGIMESRAIFGKELFYGQASLYSGIFQTPHAASITLCYSCLFIIHILKNNLPKKEQIFNLLILALGLYSLYSTFVRTGWLMFLIGLLVVISPKVFSVKNLFKYILGGFIFFTSIFYLYQYNDDFRLRLTDNHESDIVNNENFGSGRTVFWQAAWNEYKKSSLGEIIFGIGTTQVQKSIYKKVGLRIGTHNGFLDSLTANGLLGFTLLIAFFVSIFRFIQKRKKTNSYKLLLASYLALISCYFTQGNIGFSLDLYIALFLALINQEYKESKESFI